MWVKTTNSFGPQWLNLGRTDDPSRKAMETIEQLNRDCGSPSWGPEFEIVESPPPAVIRGMLARVDGQIAGLRGYQEHLRRQLEKAERAEREAGR